VAEAFGGDRSDPFHGSKAGSTSRTRDHLLGVVSIVTALMGLVMLYRRAMIGGLLSDDGTLGHAATRVQAGEWPHIDFDELYGGLLGFFHAAVFDVLGVSVRSLRFAILAGAIMIWGSVFALLRRRTEPWLAGILSTATLLLSVGLHMVSMPTWWNLVLGLPAILLVERYLTTGGMWRLTFAGLLLGVSFLVKLTAAYLALAVVAVLAARCGRTRFARAVRVAVTVGSSVAVLSLLGRAPSASGFLVFGGAWLVCAWLVLQGGGDGRAADGLEPLAVFSASSVVPIAAWAVLYASRGGLLPLFEGWFVIPALRFADASAPLRVTWQIVPFAVAGMLVGRVASKRGLTNATAIAGSITYAAMAWVWWPEAILIIAFTIPLLVLFTALCYARVTRDRSDEDEGPLLLVAASAAFVLVQFPLFNLHYVVYVIPLLVVALVWVAPRSTHGYVVLALVAMATLLMIQSERGFMYGPNPTYSRLEYRAKTIDRGGISVTAGDYYLEEVALAIRPLAAGRPIYAGPDTPVVYFLSGLDNPTRRFFDSLSVERDDSVLPELLRSVDARVVVLELTPSFSEPLDPLVLAEIEQDFPESDQFELREFELIGPLEIRWREEVGG
jgi:hypothetical protein